MFTGLVEAICRVTSAQPTGAGMRLVIDLGDLANQTRTGDSIAINGVCLTVSGLAGKTVGFDVSGETLAKSNLGELRPASAVNVELALKLTDRLGGHFVLGHIDGTATVKAIDRHGQFADMTFAVTDELLDQMVPKGSVAVDGVSLTIANVTEQGFRVTIIPQTLERTTLGTAKPGDKVNIETDIITKAVKRQLEKILPTKEKLTVEKLRESGF